MAAMCSKEPRASPRCLRPARSSSSPRQKTRNPARPPFASWPWCASRFFCTAFRSKIIYPRGGVFMSDPRYPIGKFSYSGPLTAEQKQQCIADIEQTPARLRAALRGLSDQQLNTPYRDGGWTPRQVAHHVADSHMNSYIRFKLALYSWHGRHHVAHVTSLREKMGW